MSDLSPAGRPRRLRGLLVVVLTVVIVPGIWYGIYSIWKGGKGWLVTSYMQSLMSGWLATVTGVVVGLPVAIWLTERGTAAERRQKAEEDERFAREMRCRILHTVSRELSSSLNGLEEMSQGVMTKFHFNVGHWSALASSGDLRWIDNLDVIDDLAEAYESLDVVNVLAVSWLKNLEAAADHQTAQGRSNAFGVVQRLAADAASDASRAVANALSRLNTQLGQSNTVPDEQAMSPPLASGGSRETAV